MRRTSSQRSTPTVRSVGVGGVTVDTELDETSENPVQNKAIATKLNEVFQSVSDGKAKLASAITGKGVQTDATDTFDTMAENVGNIKSGGSDGTIRNIRAHFDRIANGAVVLNFRIVEE